MKKLIYLLTILSFANSKLTAQSLTPFVISPSGGFYSNSSAQLSFTTGEMSMVETFTSGGSMLTQGFQQNYDFGVFVADHENENFAFDVFPNPGNGAFSFFIKSESSKKIKMTIFDAIGNVVLSKDLEITTGAQSHEIDLNQASEGMYILELTDNTNKFFRKIQIVK